MVKKIKKLRLFLFPCEENNYRPTALDGRFLLYVTLVLVMLKFVSVFSFTLIPETPYFADVSRAALVKMTNQERVSAGLQPLNESSELIRAAELKAQDMLLRDYFSHWSPDGVSPWHWFKVAGYDYRYAGENLAIGFLNAKDVHRSWIASPSHRNNILGPDYNDIGIAVVEGDFYGQTTFLIVQVFGSRNVHQVALDPVRDISDPVLPEEPIDIPETALTPAPEISEPVALEEPIMENDLLVGEEVVDKDQIEPEESFVLGVGPLLSPGETIELKGTKYSILNFLMFEYDEMLGQIIFYIMMFIGFVMVANVFIRFDIQHPDLIFKGLGFLLLFLIFDQFDQMTLIRMITGGPWIG